MNCKQGDLAVVVRAQLPENIGLLVTVLRGEHLDCGWMWECESARPTPAVLFGVRAPTLECLAWSHDSDLRPIRDNPGNESFVTQARKSPPRPKDVVTITERGEVQS